VHALFIKTGGLEKRPNHLEMRETWGPLKIQAFSKAGRKQKITTQHMFNM